MAHVAHGQDVVLTCFSPSNTKQIIYLRNYVVFNRQLSAQNKITKQWQNDDITIDGTNQGTNVHNIKSQYQTIHVSASVTSLLPVSFATHLKFPYDDWQRQCVLWFWNFETQNITLPLAFYTPFYIRSVEKSRLTISNKIWISFNQGKLLHFCKTPTWCQAILDPSLSSCFYITKS